MDKRLALFIVCSVLVYVGWFGLQMWLNPPRERAAQAQKGEEAKPVAVDKIVAELKGDPGDRLRWALPEIFGAPFTLGVHPALPRPQEMLARLEEVRKDEAKKAVMKAPLPDNDIQLGDDDSKLKVVLSERDASVKRMTLNQHYTASKSEALPVYKNGNKKLPEPLVLVSDEGKPEWRSYRLLVDGNGLEWRLRGKPTAEEASFQALVPGKDITITKTFRLKPGQYHVDLTLAMERTGPNRGELVYELTGPHGLPVDGQVWRSMSYRRVVMATVDKDDRRNVTRTVFDPEPIKSKKVEPLNLEGADVKVSLQYAGVMLQYFAALAVVNAEPDQPPPAYIARAEPEYVDDDQAFPQGHGAIQGKLTTKLTSRPLKLLGDKPTEHKYLLYAGPVKVRLLGYEKGVDEELPARYEYGLHLRTLTDYTDYPNGPWQTIGWTSLLIFFTNLMHSLLEFFHNIVGYYGLAIILLTLVVRGAMFPISRKQALAAKKMQALKPELDKLKAKHSDRQALAQAQMELYRQHGVNPMSGCIVIFMQLPVFMGLYYALNESVHLRLAGFLWIENLAAPDMLFRWGDNAITQLLKLGPYFNLLPILSIILMFVQQKLLAPPPADETQAMQMKMMNYMMIFFGYMFYWVASGLCLYFIMSSIWGLTERKLLPKIVTDTTPPAAAGAKAAKRGESRDGNGGLRSKIGGWWARLLEEAKKK